MGCGSRKNRHDFYRYVQYLTGNRNMDRYTQTSIMSYIVQMDPRNSQVYLHVFKFFFFPVHILSANEAKNIALPSAH